jgi:Ohr subfamily peroxiredoxin
MSLDVKYRTSATANGGRDGRARTEDSKLDLMLSTPKELGGAGGEGTNPEQLFAAGYSACFLSALKFAAHQLKLHVSDDATVTAMVGIGMRTEGGFGLDVKLAVA